jgi:hypothetical protein
MPSPFEKKAQIKQRRNKVRATSYVTEKKQKEQAKLAKTQLAKEARKELARRDFAKFVEYVIRDEDGSPVIAAPHQIAWWDHLKYCWQIDKIPTIISPMSFAKTSWMALALPLWLLGRNPNLRIIIVSSAEDIAAKRLQQIQRYITESPEYREVFPWVKPDYSRAWNQQNLNVVREARGVGGFVGSIDHSVSAYGYTANAGIGVRADVILPDDIASEKNSSSEADRNTLFRLFTTQWLSRAAKKPVLDRDGNQIAPTTIVAPIGTRYHVEDIYATLPMVSQEAYCTLIQAVSEDFEDLDFEILGGLVYPPHPLTVQYGGVDPEQVEPTPEPVTAQPFKGSMPGWGLRPPEQLRQTAAQIGHSAFQKGFRQKPHAKTDLFFPSFDADRAVRWDCRPLVLDNGVLVPTLDPGDPFYINPDWLRLAGIDLSGAKRRGKCWFCIAVGPGRVRHLVDIQLVQSTEPEFLKLIDARYGIYHPKVIHVENNALQDEIRNWAKELNLLCWPKMKGVHTGKQKTDQERGLPALDVQYSHYKWRISVPHAKGRVIQPDQKRPGQCACPHCVFIFNVENMTYEDLDDTPDTIMAQWQTDRAVRHGERFTEGSVAISTIQPDQVMDSVRHTNSERKIESLGIPVGVNIFDGKSFGSKKQTYDFGRSNSKPDWLKKRYKQN